MAKCLECALIECQLQSLLFLHLHHSTHQQENDEENENEGDNSMSHTCHLGHHQESNNTSKKDWPHFITNLMIEVNSQRLVHHLLSTLNHLKGNSTTTINGNSSPDDDSSCHATGSNSDEKAMEKEKIATHVANDSVNSSMHIQDDEPINYCDSQTSIKSTSVKLPASSSKLQLYDRPNEQRKRHFSSRKNSSNEKLYCFNNKIHLKDQQFSQKNHLLPEKSSYEKRLRQMDLPDSSKKTENEQEQQVTSSTESQLMAKSIGYKLRKLAESFHLSQKSNCIQYN